MKKHLLIVGLIFTFPFSPATAVTKCVALNSGTECSYVYPGAYAVDWTLNCTSNGTNITISGISQCSSTSGSIDGQTTTSLTVNNGTDDKYCWCKLVSPGVSPWVFHNTITNADFCARNCARDCALDSRDNKSFRTAMFGNLSD